MAESCDCEIWKYALIILLKKWCHGGPGNVKWDGDAIRNRLLFPVDKAFYNTDSTTGDSVYSRGIFLPWLLSNVLISVLVLSLISQETVVWREPAVFTAAHFKECLSMYRESPKRAS